MISLSKLGAFAFALLLGFASIEATRARGYEHSPRVLGKKKMDKKKGKGKGKKGTRNLPISLGARPYYLVDSLPEGDLKDQLEYCAYHMDDFKKSDWSIGHRGACLQFPEHTLESYKAAVIQGAGIIECDVTITKDGELICRHAQCDLHTTTDVVTRPEMNAKCTQPFVAGQGARCCASDFTLAEIQSLCAKMDYADSSAQTPEDYVYGNIAYYRTDLYGRECHAVPTHKESIELGLRYNVKFTPELKSAEVLPLGYTQNDYAQQMIDEYDDFDVDPEDVWPQSFNWDDVNYWVNYTPFYQAVALEGQYDLELGSTQDFANRLAELDEKVYYYAPPTQMLLSLMNGNIVASNLANYLKSKGYSIITWTIERSSPLSTTNGGFYYGTSSASSDAFGDEIFFSDGHILTYLHALYTEVGVVGVFSDWPATTTFYANCMDI